MTPKEFAPSTYGVDAVQALLSEHFPETQSDLGAFAIIEVKRNYSYVRLPFEGRFIRPGGTISGPTMFMVADFASYVAILAEHGEKALQAVTTTLTINFLARPEPGDLFGTAEILRMGRRQAVCDARVFSAAGNKLVAQGSCIYALPHQSR